MLILKNTAHVLAFLSAFFLFGISTNYGLGISSDSTVYLEGARSILQHGTYEDGYGKFINHFPPLYSLILALIAKIVTQGDLLLAGRIFNSVVFGGFIYVLMQLLQLYIKNRWLVSLSIIFIIFSKFSGVFLWQMTEGVFAFLLLLQFWIWAKTDIGGIRNRKLWLLLGILSGLMVLIRFAGFSVLGWWFLVAIYFTYKFKIGARNILVFIVGSMITLIPWFVYTKWMGVEAVSRKLFFHPPDFHKFMELGNTVLCWFSGNNLLSFISFVILGMFWLWSLKRVGLSIFSHIKGKVIYLLFSIYYVVFIVISFTLFDAHIQFDNRIFSPIFITVFLFLIGVIKSLFDDNFEGISTTFKVSQTISVIFLICLFISQVWSGVNQYRSFYSNGLGYARKEIQESESIQALNRLSTKSVYTNFPQLLNLYVSKEKKVMGTPLKFSTNNGTPNERYKTQVEDMLDKVMKQGAVILIFKESSRDFYFSRLDVETYNNELIERKIKVAEYIDALLAYPKRVK